MSDGLNTSRGIGDGRAQVWDFSPVLRFAMGIQQQEEQKKRLAQKTFDEVMSSYDPRRAKLRAADVPLYLKDYEDFAKAKRALASGRIKDSRQIAELNHFADQAAGRMQQRVAKSVQQAEFEAKLADDNLRRYDDYDENTPTVIAAMRQSSVDQIDNNEIAGVGKVPFNLRDISNYLSPQFDPKKVQHWSKSKKGLTRFEKLPNGMQREVFSTELEMQPEQIINESQLLFNSQGDAQREFKKVFKSDVNSGTYNAVVAKFAEKYPELAKKTKVVDPATYYAVRSIVAFEPEVSYGKEDFTAQQKFRNSKELMQQSAAIAHQYRMKYGEEQDVWVEGYIDELTPTADSSTGEFFGHTNNPIEIDPVLATALNFPDKLSYNPKNDTYYITYYKKDKNGNTVDKDGNPIKDGGEPAIEGKPLTLSRNQLKLAIRRAAPKDVQTVREMTGNKKAGTKSGTVESSGKKYKYKGKSITDAAIKKAAEASGLTVDEYIKEAGIEQE